MARGQLDCVAGKTVPAGAATSRTTTTTAASAGGAADPPIDPRPPDTIHRPTGHNHCPRRPSRHHGAVVLVVVVDLQVFASEPGGRYFPTSKSVASSVICFPNFIPTFYF